MGIKENLTKIKEQIGNNKVKIIAVTKYASKQQIDEAYKLGINNFGESYAQDALKKITSEESNRKLIHWHFIGRLQKNKVKYLIGKINLIHSVDSLELAQVINNISCKEGIIQDVLLQINASGEATKAGFYPTNLISIFPDLQKLQNIKILGLMTIAPNTEDTKSIKVCFLVVSKLKDEINKTYMTNITDISMGMTGDYKIALECGSTMIRLGRAIFKE